MQKSSSSISSRFPWKPYKEESEMKKMKFTGHPQDEGHEKE